MFLLNFFSTLQIFSYSISNASCIEESDPFKKSSKKEKPSTEEEEINRESIPPREQCYECPKSKESQEETESPQENPEI